MAGQSLHKQRQCLRQSPEIREVSWRSASSTEHNVSASGATPERGEAPQLRNTGRAPAAASERRWVVVRPERVSVGRATASAQQISHLSSVASLRRRGAERVGL